METMKEGGVYTLVQFLDGREDLPNVLVLDGPGDHVTRAKSAANTKMPAQIGPDRGPVAAVIVRVEAVLMFRPALVPIEPTKPKPEPKGDDQRLPLDDGIGSVDGMPAIVD